MKVLIVGSGGREHALAWKASQSQTVTQIFVAPGNGGTEQEPNVTNIPIPSNNVDELAEFLKKYDIQTRRFFYPLHMQPCYQDTNLVGDFNINEFPVSTNVFERGISLPSSYQLNNKEQEHVVLLIKKFYENRD